VNEQEFAELSAAHALGALSPEEARAFAAALAADPSREALVAADRETAAALAEGVPEVAPPAGVRDELLARILLGDVAERRPEEPDAAPEPVAPAPRRRRRAVWYTLAASLVLIVGIGVGAVWIGHALTPPAAVTALEQIQNSPDGQVVMAPMGDEGRAELYWSTSTGQAVLVSAGLPSIGSGQTFEAWYVSDGVPRSAGVFDASGGDATALLAGSMSPGDTVAITVEQDGGSPTGAPTSTPLVAIPTA
jgi:anti-sigma-K factor RskA